VCKNDGRPSAYFLTRLSPVRLPPAIQGCYRCRFGCPTPWLPRLALLFHLNGCRINPITCTALFCSWENHRRHKATRSPGRVARLPPSTRARPTAFNGQVRHRPISTIPNFYFQLTKLAAHRPGRPRSAPPSAIPHPTAIGDGRSSCRHLQQGASRQKTHIHAGGKTPKQNVFFYWPLQRFAAVHKEDKRGRLSQGRAFQPALWLTGRADLACPPGGGARLRARARGGGRRRSAVARAEAGTSDWLSRRPELGPRFFLLLFLVKTTYKTGFFWPWSVFSYLDP
jgi:hypothetical protein